MSRIERALLLYYFLMLFNFRNAWMVSILLSRAICIGLLLQEFSTIIGIVVIKDFYWFFFCFIVSTTSKYNVTATYVTLKKWFYYSGKVLFIYNTVFGKIKKHFLIPFLLKKRHLFLCIWKETHFFWLVVKGIVFSIGRQCR